MATYPRLEGEIDSALGKVELRAGVLRAEEGALAFQLGLNLRGAGLERTILGATARRLNITHNTQKGSFKQNLDSLKTEKPLGEDVRAALLAWIRRVFDQMERDRAQFEAERAIAMLEAAKPKEAAKPEEDGFSDFDGPLVEIEDEGDEGNLLLEEKRPMRIHGEDATL